MWSARLDELQAGIKIAGRNISNLRYAEGKNELKSLLMSVKEESEKAGLKLVLIKYIKKTKIIASSPIISWKIEGKKVEVVTDFLFLGPKITADGDCNHEIRRQLLLGRKAMTNLESVLKNRHHCADKVPIIKVVFPVVMYSCESWTIKMAEHQRIDAFKLWCWRRLLRIPWTERRSKLSILKEINPEYSLKGLMLKLQYFGHLVWIVDSLKKSLLLGKIEGRRRRGHQRMRWLDDITDAMDMNLKNSGKWWGTGRPGVLQSMGSQRVWPDDWTTTANISYC